MQPEIYQQVKFPSTFDNNYLASYDIYNARRRFFPATPTAQSISTRFVLLEGHLTDKSGTMVGHLNTTLPRLEEFLNDSIFKSSIAEGS